ncbi:type II secretion system protein GspM [Aquibium sp. LZ166]|uniref:Type II secretion system protein GspM n=1 Tax=Aquibium pacificus TaxID=3153579 RepID=A0ABV3SC79_9HYPH
MSAARRSWFDGRLSSLFVVVVLVVGAGILAGDAWMSWQAEQEALAVLERRLAQMEERAASMAGSGSATEEDTLKDLQLLMGGRTQGLASAQFQREISDLAAATGAVVRAVDAPQVETVEDVTDEAGNPLVRVRLNADVEVMEQSLPQFLHAIEVSLPVIVVDSIVLRPNRRIGDVTGDSAMAGGDRALSLRMTLSAFRIGEEI